jgi:hypothetical protein
VVVVVVVLSCLRLPTRCHSAYCGDKTAELMRELDLLRAAIVGIDAAVAGADFVMQEQAAAAAAGTTHVQLAKLAVQACARGY